MHRILRQTVELSVGRQSDVIAVQERVSRLLRGGSPVALARVFDTIAGDEVVRIRRLELDLGEIGGADWPAEFVRRLGVRAAHALGQLREPVDTAGAADAAAAGSAAPPLVVASPADAKFEELSAFLARGRLPWWSDAEVHANWVRERVAGLDRTRRTRLVVAARAESNVVARLVIHLHAGELERLFAEVLEVIWPGMGALEQGLTVLLALSPERSAEWRRQYWQVVLAPPGRGRGESTTEPGGILRRWLEAAAAVRKEWSPELIAALERTIRAGLPATWLESFDVAWEGSAFKGGRRAAPVRPKLGETGTRTPNAVPREAGPLTDLRTHRRPPPLASVPAAMPAEGHTAVGRDPGADPVLVSAAGVVLLHPFLGELFAHLDLLDERTFVDVRARRLGVELLGYLSFGRAAVGEPQMILPKLLCGVPLDEPLAPCELDARAQEAADALLGAVLHHWSVLKSASVAWLREQFLLRAGKLERVDDAWKLTVETRAQDVLLTRLPWGIGVVSLPWLDSMLYVRWGE